MLKGLGYRVQGACMWRGPRTSVLSLGYRVHGTGYRVYLGAELVDLSPQRAALTLNGAEETLLHARPGTRQRSLCLAVGPLT